MRKFYRTISKVSVIAAILLFLAADLRASSVMVQNFTDSVIEEIRIGGETIKNIGPGCISQQRFEGLVVKPIEYITVSVRINGTKKSCEAMFLGRPEVPNLLSVYRYKEEIYTNIVPEKNSWWQPIPSEFLQDELEKEKFTYEILPESLALNLLPKLERKSLYKINNGELERIRELGVPVTDGMFHYLVRGLVDELKNSVNVQIFGEFVWVNFTIMGGVDPTGNYFKKVIFVQSPIELKYAFVDLLGVL